MNGAIGAEAVRAETMRKCFGTVRRAMWVLGLTSVVLGLGVFVLAAAVAREAGRRPRVVSVEENGVRWREVGYFHLRADHLQQYLRSVLGNVLSADGGDLAGVAPWCSSNLVADVVRVTGGAGTVPSKAYSKRSWSLVSVKRCADARLGGRRCMVFAVRGMRCVSDGVRNVSGGLNVIFDTQPILHVAFVRQVPQSAVNPWGLNLEAVDEVRENREALRIWDQARDLAGTIDLNGNTILPPKTKTS